MVLHVATGPFYESKRSALRNPPFETVVSQRSSFGEWKVFLWHHVPTILPQALVGWDCGSSTELENQTLGGQAKMHPHLRQLEKDSVHHGAEQRTPMVPSWKKSADDQAGVRLLQLFEICLLSDLIAVLEVCES